MSTPQPRIRMFAGPNGSGKSTLKSVLPLKLLGSYINPDEIEKEINANGLDLSTYGISTSNAEIIDFFKNSNLLKSIGVHDLDKNLKLSGTRLTCSKDPLNSYYASVLADFLRRKLIQNRSSFTFETVMSSSDKIELLKYAKAQSYRTYLYYIATDDPAINISRVRSRVTLGGHSVPEDKIISRYSRSLNLLRSAIAQTDRAYVFDNSNHLQEPTWLAEITDGRLLESKTTILPKWFKSAVLDKMSSPPAIT